MAIDWNHWLKLYKPLNEEIILLTLELNPDDIKIDHFMGERYIVNKENLLGELNLEYDRRMRLLKESRFRPFAYLENLNDGGWGNYFSADGSGTQVITNRFLLWLKNEEIGWDLPKELATYIEKLDKPNEPHWAQELVDNLNKKITQSEVIQKVIIKPKEWNPLAEQYADDILKSNPQISLEKISIQIAEKFKVQGIQSVHGKPIKPATISRVLSDWGFTLKRINADKK